MCIRDSRGTGAHHILHPLRSAERNAPPEEDEPECVRSRPRPRRHSLSGIAPVSYTHLGKQAFRRDASVAVGGQAVIGAFKGSGNKIDP